MLYNSHSLTCYYVLQRMLKLTKVVFTQAKHFLISIPKVLSFVRILLQDYYFFSSLTYLTWLISSPWANFTNGLQETIALVYLCCFVGIWQSENTGIEHMAWMLGVNSSCVCALWNLSIILLLQMPFNGAFALCVKEWVKFAPRCCVDG